MVILRYHDYSVPPTTTTTTIDQDIKTSVRRATDLSLNEDKRGNTNSGERISDENPLILIFGSSQLLKMK